MHSAARNSLIAISGVAAAVAFGVPATAQASTTSVSTADCAASQDIFLLNTTSGEYGAVGPKFGYDPPLFDFNATSAQTLCQAPVASNGSYVIYTNSGGYCLEYNTGTNEVFQSSNPENCFTNAASAVTDWKFIYITRVGLGSAEYEVQSTDNGECVYAGSPAVLGPCSTAGADLFITYSLPLQIS
jgi:hypothetical protein